MKSLTRKVWNSRLKKIAAIEGMKKLPKLPRKRGYMAMFEKGLTPVQAVARVIKAKVEDQRFNFERWLDQKFPDHGLGFEVEEGYDETDSISYLAYVTSSYFDVDGVIKLSKKAKSIITKGAKKHFGNFKEIDWDLEMGFIVKLNA